MDEMLLSRTVGNSKVWRPPMLSRSVQVFALLKEGSLSE